jgi:hypothetical protein
MSLFEVYNPRSCYVLGFYEAETAEEAIEACCKDAGYANAAESAAVAGGGELRATEINQTMRVFELPDGCQIAISADWQRYGSPIHVAGQLAPFVLNGDIEADTRRALIWGLVRFGVAVDREEAERLADGTVELVEEV